MKLLIISLAIITLLGILVSRMLGGKPNLVSRLLMGFVMSVAVSYFVNTKTIVISSNQSVENNDTLVDTLKKVTNFNIAPMQMLVDPVTQIQAYSKETTGLANNVQNEELFYTTANCTVLHVSRADPLDNYFNSS